MISIVFIKRVLRSIKIDPQLFDESQNINSGQETNVNEGNDANDEDELEIPAFLRRQKN